MRKLIIGLLVAVLTILSVNAEAVTKYNVVKLNNPASYSSAGTKYLPAVVRGQNAAVAALETVVLALPQTKSAQIAAALAIAGASYGAQKLFDYLADEGFPIDPQTQKPMKTVPGEPYPTPQTKDKGNVPEGADWEEKPEPNPPVVDFPCESGTATYTQWGNHKSFTDSVSGQLIMVVKASALCMGCCAVPEYDKYSAYVLADPDSPLPESVGGTGEPQKIPAAPEDLSAPMADKLGSGDKGANDALNDTLNRINESLQNLNDTLRGNQQWQTIQDLLDSEITSATKTELDTKIADPNAPGTYATQTTTTTTNNSTTYNTTTNNYYENDGTFAPLSPYSQGTQTTKSAFEQPEVGDFSQLMTDFIETMQETDLFSLPGLMTDSIPSGGDCELTINLGQHFGGTKTVSFCEWATALSYIKAVLLCLASVVAVGIVCKGGVA